MLELNDVLAVISKCNAAMNGTISKMIAEMGEDDASGLEELRNIINQYTVTVCDAIVREDNERVCSMLEGMEKYEFKTDGEGEE